MGHARRRRRGRRASRNTHARGKLPRRSTSELLKIATRLEKHFRDMQDMEFTIERERLFMLQTRNGKRTAEAAVRIAVDMADEKLIDRRTALMRVEPVQLEQSLHPRLDPESSKKT